MTDPDAALRAIRKGIIWRRNVACIHGAGSRDAEAMHTALSELLATHQPDDRHAYCCGCGEVWPCDTYDIISTALGDVTT